MPGQSPLHGFPLPDIAPGLSALPVLRVSGLEWSLADAVVHRHRHGLEARFPDGTLLQLRRGGHGATDRLEVRLLAGVPLQVDEVGVRLQRAQQTRILIDGYHSWDWAGLRDARRPGSGWWGAIWGNPRENGVAVSLAEPPRTGALALRWDGAGLDARTVGTPLQERSRTGAPRPLGIQLAAGEMLEAEPIRLRSTHGASVSGLGLPEALPGSVLPKPRQAGWMSWSCYGSRVTPQRVLDASDLVPAEGLMLLDDGWMEWWGDWSERRDLGMSLRDLSSTLQRLDRSLGVWMAPFLVDMQSEMAKTHPDWLLRDGRGDLVVDVRPERAQYVLDASRPEVRAHLSAVGHRLGAAGVSALKIDFLYAGAFPGVRGQGWSDISAYRAGVAALAAGFRQTAGPESRIYACGAPAAPLVGLVDACRSGDDAVAMIPTRHTWPIGLFRHTPRLRAAQRRNLDARAWLWGATVPPDPDAITIGHVGLQPAADQRALREWMELGERGGGPFLLSDRPERISAARRQLVVDAMVRAQGRVAMPARGDDPLAGPTTPMGVDTFDSPVPAGLSL